MQTKPVNILVTGGWDSTFRLLYLVLVEKRPVQPIYILDPERWSLVQELKAIAGVKEAVAREFPAAQKRLLHTIMYDRTDVRPDPAIQKAERLINERVHIGGQYAWLAAAVKQFGIKNPEIGIEATHNTTGCLPTIRHLLIDGEGDVKQLDPEQKDTPEYVMFGDYRYPITHLFKPDMADIAKEHGFLDILEFSWFCHRPNFLGQACGMCNPCMDAMNKHMAYRVPPFGRFCFHLKKTLDPRPWLKKSPELYTLLKEQKKRILALLQKNRYR